MSRKLDNKNYTRYVALLWILYLTPISFLIIVFTSAATGRLGEMPSIEQLENPKTNLATAIYSSDGVVLGKFYLNDNRTPINFSELPKNIVDALIDTEDERFYSHSGIDFKGTLRAIFYLGKKGGASTITQQLARQLFVGVRSRNKIEAVTQKAKEWVLAVKLERRFTKSEIIAMYLNIYDFGYQADGIESAAKIYFNKKPSELLIEESATLVGMLKNSSLYNPRRRPELTTDRRNIVFNQMFRNGLLSKNDLDSLRKLPLNIKFTPDSHREGLATYFRAYIQNFIQKWAKENPKQDGEKYDIYRDGLKIYTTIDSRLQAIAERSVNTHMSNLQKEFFKQNNNELNPTAPFLDLREGQIDTLLNLSAKRSERWRKMKLSGKSEMEIKESFKKLKPMTVFDWNGERDTIMSPLDSIRYYKNFLRASMMSMEPSTGHVKVWVGGFNYKHFHYDQVRQGRRQILNPFYMLQLLTSCVYLLVKFFLTHYFALSLLNMVM